MHLVCPCSLDQLQGLGDVVLPLARPELHAHLCEGREWLEVLPESNGMRKGKFSQRKEVGVGDVLYQKNEGREAGKKNITWGSLHAYCLILSHSEPMKTQKTTFPGIYCQECYPTRKSCASHGMQ